MADAADHIFARFVLWRHLERRKRTRFGVGESAPGRRVNGQGLTAEERLELRPLFRASLHWRYALETRDGTRGGIGGKTLFHDAEVLRMIRGKLQFAALLQAMPKRLQE